MDYTSKALLALLNNLATLFAEAAKQLANAPDEDNTVVEVHGASLKAAKTKKTKPKPKTEAIGVGFGDTVEEAKAEAEKALDKDTEEKPKKQKAKPDTDAASNAKRHKRIQRRIVQLLDGWITKDDMREALNMVGAKLLADVKPEQFDEFWAHFKKPWKEMQKANKGSK